MTVSQTTSRTTRRRASGPPKGVLLLVLIPLLLEAVGVFWPALQGVLMSFTKWNGFTPATNVGVQNYVDLMSDPVFGVALKNTAIWIVVFGGLSFLGGLAVALLLSAERRGVAIYRTALFLPIVFSMVVTSLIWSAVFQPNGVLDAVLEMLGLSQFSTVWLGNPDTALWAVMVAALWREIGYIMVLFIAGIKAIDPATLEAARVDGASAWQRFAFVVLPQLRPVTVVVLSVIVIDSLRSFDIVWAMTGGGPFHSTELLSTFMFSTAFQTRALGYASAIACVIFLLAIAVIVSYLVRAFSEEKEQ